MWEHSDMCLKQRTRRWADMYCVVEILWWMNEVLVGLEWVGRMRKGNLPVNGVKVRQQMWETHWKLIVEKLRMRVVSCHWSKKKTCCNEDREIYLHRTSHDEQCTSYWWGDNDIDNLYASNYNPRRHTKESENQFYDDCKDVEKGSIDTQIFEGVGNPVDDDIELDRVT